MIDPEGVAKVCCVADRLIADANGPLDVAAHTADAIWNSAHMRDLRRAMTAGERAADCTRCYTAEAANGTSLRTQENRARFGDDPGGLTAHAAASACAGHRQDGLPSALNLAVGNLCNLTCRMCSGRYSSRIAQHPVLSRWAPDLARPTVPARSTVRRIGPRPALGVRATGVGPVDADGIAWTAPGARLELPVAWFEKPMLLGLAIAPGERPRAAQIRVNRRQLFDGVMGAGDQQLDLDISWLPDDPQLEIALDSAAGLPLRAIDLRLIGADSATRAAGKPAEQPSANHTPAIEALLANPGLEQVTFSGGEPTLMPEVAEAIDYLIADGRAGAITISLVTNGTRLDRALIDKLKRFRAARVVVSVDGVGPLFDYIRVPARWDRVAANLRALAQHLGPAHIFLQPTVQAYNLLDLVAICRFADSLAVGIELLDILVWPERLTVQVMPPAARHRALDRLRRYRTAECRPVNHAAIDALIVHLERTMGDHRPDLLPEFLRFTEALDQVHGQRFQDACPELHAVLAGTFGV
jgi:MoaA/NifB/PqqE/SkfB family radical SAM enzyme